MHLFASHLGTFEVEYGADGPRLLPFRHDPDPSPVGLAYLDLVRHPARVLSPMVRAGWLENPHDPQARRLRGRDRFVPMPWPEVASLIADTLVRTRDQYGNQGIFGGSYGWASAGRFHHAQSQLKRLLNLSGGFTSAVNTYSYGAAAVLLPHVLGPDYKDACDTAPSWSDIDQGCELLVGFGGFRLSNAQVEAGGTGAHRAGPALRAMAAKGKRIVVFSPSAADAPAGPNVTHHFVRPNTDAAVMLGLCHTILASGALDRGLVDRCTSGFDAFADYLTGSTDGIVKSAAWAAAISGVSEDAIQALARSLVASPSLVHVSWSLQRARFGEQPYWAAIALGCMAGHVGKPGCGFAFGLTAVNSAGQPVRRLKGPAFDQGRNPVRHHIPVARITELLEGEHETMDYDGQVLLLPKIGLVWWAGGNPFHHHQDLNRLADAFRRPETIIVTDSLWTATARHADIVLPAALPFERSDIAASSRDNWLIHSRRIMAPPPGVLTDHDGLRHVASAMGLDAAFTEGRSESEWIAHLYEGYRARYPELPDAETFFEYGYAGLDLFDAAPAPADHFRAFVADPAAHPLRTPSGRIVLSSPAIAGFGYNDHPGHPSWMEPEECLLSDAAAAYPFHLLSPQPATRLHSQLQHAGPSQGSKRHGLEVVEINPGDAAHYGIADGAIVEIHNERGRILATARFASHLMRKVLVLPTGSWFEPHEDNRGRVDRGSNPNTLTSIRPTSTLSQATAPNSCLVAIRPSLGP
ncbi:molybdopterin-dependent oxidoreductase [Pelagibacterium lacus]|uniref:Oxidoreductase n=1 Tax=Pelagibacterium lacus TaxID=2282655 RepID=A0A369W3K7_9HYPH|nr:molybdopterin-dependent oxidoreductase [Pelagibacterium lacus]RDE09266.1 oxidoreductase [Pelagibacterium lacus]